MNTHSTLNFNEVKNLTFIKLIEMHKELQLKGARNKPSFIIKQICNHHYNTLKHKIKATGVLDTMQDGFGFLRLKENKFLPQLDDIYVSPTHIKRHCLRTGDVIEAYLKVGTHDKSAYLAVEQMLKIHGEEVELYQPKERYENLTPLYPQQQLQFEGKDSNLIGRIIDIIAPIGAGQRGLIVAPPKTGKTTILRYLAKNIKQLYPKTHLIVLLIGERPEEVTEFKNLFHKDEEGVEIIASTFDDPAANQVNLARITIERARSKVENNIDVVILLDSLTRLARSYNEVTPSSGKVLSGGLESIALQAPKRFFGAARKTQEAASLTVIASVLVDTGSKMDEIIFEEFKGTGNMEIYLSRKLSEKHIFPSINLHKSGTRREELLLPKDICPKISLLRRLLHDMSEAEALEFLVAKLREHKNNESFFKSMLQNRS